ncbi:MAG: hypothetical protein V1874_02725 [Spirochaetota bacterium]
MSVQKYSMEITNISQPEWKNLAGKKIYFGHQSVGYNIIDGIKEIIKNNPNIKLNIIETSKQGDFNSPVFAHSVNGNNADPMSKIKSFLEKMENGLGDKADAAFFKFCYVDFNYNSDVKLIFQNYKESMKKLEKKFKKTKFLHFTIPLRMEKDDIVTFAKNYIKKISGRKTGEAYDNIIRHEFNQLMRSEYSNNLFDIAKIESTDQNGILKESSTGGIKHHSLLKEYTNDGGHLNERGASFAADHFLAFLASHIK